MASSSRPGFLAILWLFLRMPSVWVGGVIAALVLLFSGDVWPGVAVPGAIAVVLASVGLEFVRDRRRGIGRRLIFRGGMVSPRRTIALLVAIGLIASASAALVGRMGTTIRRGIENEVRSRSTPNQKRGYY